MRLLRSVLVCLLLWSLYFFPTSLIAQTPTTNQATPTSISSAQRWAFDTPRTYGRELGYIKGIVSTLDERGHAHTVYQSSLEFMDKQNTAAVIVHGVTAVGDRYEQRLWTTEKGFATNSIASSSGRVGVLAGVSDPDTFRLRAWFSENGGETWTASFIPTPNGRWGALGFLPDGRSTIVSAEPVGDYGCQNRIYTETYPQSYVWSEVFVFPQSGIFACRQTLWQRDPTNSRQQTLPALAIGVGEPAGVGIATTNDGIEWSLSSMQSEIPSLMRISAVDGSLALIHEVWGRGRLWIARSNRSVTAWQVQQLNLPDSQYTNANTFLDADDVVLFVSTCYYTERPVGSNRQQVCIWKFPRDTWMDESRWLAGIARPWTPVPMANQTQQYASWVAVQGVQAHMVWVGMWFPADWNHINATQAAFVPTFFPMYTTIRIADLAQLQPSQ